MSVHHGPLRNTLSSCHQGQNIDCSAIPEPPSTQTGVRLDDTGQAGVARLPFIVYEGRS
ncbi:MAG: hypothetical protein ACYCT3_10090 [Acidiferrobacter sp.]